MPQVPRYSTPEVDVAGLPAPRAQGVSQEAFGSGMGKALEGVSSSMFAVAKMEQEKADRTAVDGAKADLLTAANTLQTDALGKFGTDAVGGKDADGKEVPDVAHSSLEAYDKSTAEIMNRLTTDAQKQAFHHEALYHRSTIEKSVLTHVIAEREKVRVSTTEGLLDAQFNTAGLATDQDARTKALNDIQTTLSDLYRNQPEEVYSAKRDAVWSKLHEMWISQDAKTNPAQALNDFKDMKANGDLAPDAVIRVEDHLKHTATNLLAQSEAAATWSEMGPAATLKADPEKYRGNIDLVPIDIAKMEERVREKFKDNPDAVDAAIVKLHGYAQAHEYTAKQNRDHNTDVIYNRLTTEGIGSYTDIMASSEFAGLDGKDQKAFRLAVESEKRSIRSESREIRAEQKRQTEEKRLEFLGSLTPEMILTTPEADLRAQMPYLGAANVNHLISEKRRLTSDRNALSVAKADDAMLRDEAVGAGLDYAYKPKTKEQLQTMGALRDRVQEAIRVEQVRTGQKLDDNGQRRVIRDQLLKVHALKSGKLWGVNDEEVFQFQAESQDFVVPGASSEDVGMAVSALKGAGFNRPTYSMVQEAVRRLRMPRGGR